MPQKLIWTPIHPKTCAALSQNAVTHVASNPSEFGNNCPSVASRGPVIQSTPTPTGTLHCAPGQMPCPCHGRDAGLDLIGHVTAPAVTPFSAKGTPLDTPKLAKIVGHDGEQSGDVYKITVRRDDLDMKEHGAVINPRMGLNTWAAFTGTQEDA